MPVVHSQRFNPPWPFTQGHFSTLYPYLLREKPRHAYTRERICTPDHDFFDVDYLRNGHSRLAVICHGLEGSSGSQYVAGLVEELKGNWDVAAINYRSCSGELNLTATLYHSGFTADLHLLIDREENTYHEIALIGFSLGGNMVLKYTLDGYNDLSEKIKTVTAVSVPCDLEHSGYRLLKWHNKLYVRAFLNTLKEKMEAKYAQGFSEIQIDLLGKTKSLFDFDEYFTGPLHGFGDALGYYRTCSSRPLLNRVAIPTLILNARNDSFLSPECFPEEEAHENDQLYLLAPAYGGHVGFSAWSSFPYWSEKVIALFLEEKALN